MLIVMVGVVLVLGVLVVCIFVHQTTNTSDLAEEVTGEAGEVHIDTIDVMLETSEWNYK